MTTPKTTGTQASYEPQACGDCGEFGNPMRFHTKLDCIAHKYRMRQLPAEDITSLFRYAEVGEAAFRAPNVDTDEILKALREERQGAINVR